MNKTALQKVTRGRPHRRADGEPASPGDGILTAKNRAFIDALIANPALPVAELAAMAGLKERAGYTALKKPVVQAEINRRVRETLGVKGFALAASRIMHLMGNAASEHVQADTSKFVLQSHGVNTTRAFAPGTGDGISLTIVLKGTPGDDARVISASNMPSGDGRVADAVTIPESTQ